MIDIAKEQKKALESYKAQRTLLLQQVDMLDTQIDLLEKHVNLADTVMAHLDPFGFLKGK